MKATIYDLESFRITVQEIIRLANSYYPDLEQYAFRNFFDVYNYVRNLPYVRDPVGLETVSRPAFTLRLDWNGPRDCDDKTVILCAAAILFKIPYRIIVCGKTDRPHHVYPEIFFENNWMPADATYPDEIHSCSFGKKLYGEKFREVFYP